MRAWFIEIYKTKESLLSEANSVREFTASDEDKKMIDSNIEYYNNMDEEGIWIPVERFQKIDSCEKRVKEYLSGGDSELACRITECYVNKAYPHLQCWSVKNQYSNS